MKTERTFESRIEELRRLWRASQQQSKPAVAVLDANAFEALRQTGLPFKNPRKLHVEFFSEQAGPNPPKGSTIRLKGQWLHKLGFEAGQTVEITAKARGVLEIRVLEHLPPSPEFQIEAMRLDHAIAADEARKSQTV